MLKKFFCAAASALLLVLAVGSCNNPGDNGPGYATVFEVTLPDSFNSSWEGDTYPLSIRSNVTWRVQYDEGSDWFAVMPDYWEDYGKEPYTQNAHLVVESNDSNTIRKGHCVIIPAHGRRVEISVTQAAKPDGVE